MGIRWQIQGWLTVGCSQEWSDVCLNRHLNLSESGRTFIAHSFILPILSVFFEQTGTVSPLPVRRVPGNRRNIRKGSSSRKSRTPGRPWRKVAGLQPSGAGAQRLGIESRELPDGAGLWCWWKNSGLWPWAVGPCGSLSPRAGSTRCAVVVGRVGTPFDRQTTRRETLIIWGWAVSEEAHLHWQIVSKKVWCMPLWKMIQKILKNVFLDFCGTHVITAALC